jgi:hypothetical protein
VLQEATNWGLMNLHPAMRSYLRLQPVLTYFLRSCLRTPEQLEVKLAVETAFRQFYTRFGAVMVRELMSREAKGKRLGQLLVSLEYENLVTALNLALDAQVSIYPLHGVLSLYLESIQDHRRRQELGETVLARLEKYPTNVRAGPLAIELATVLDEVAGCQLELNQYTMAEASYQKALNILSEATALDVELREKGKAGIVQNLGIVMPPAI